MRQHFDTRRFLLRGEAVRENILALVRNLPCDPARPLEILVREEIKGRRMDQNALMWAGPLRDMAEQAWMEDAQGVKRRYSAEVWHELFKRELLPENFDPALCMEGYEKWRFLPNGDPVLMGSTTQLTKKGFAQYLEALYAFGAALGVQFHANPNEREN